MFKLLALVSLALATQGALGVAVYGQCGGIGYSGSTVCDDGSVCTFSNDYYSQCLPGSAPTTTKATTTTSRASTTLTGTTATSAPTSAATFNNPVIYQDYPDLDVFRVGDVFYYSSSTFAFSPGAPVLKSYDLVNWTPVTHSVPRLNFGTQYDLNGSSSRAYVKGIWASTLRYRQSTDTFHWMGCASGGGSTYVWTASGTKAGTNNGEVSSWNWVSKGTLPRCYYDQGLLIDTDNTMYVAYGSTTLNIAQLSSDGLSEVKTQAVYKPSDNLYLEGSRLYKINGWYYIWTTKPANEQYVLRSKSVWGPYERQLLLSNIKGPLSSAGVAHQGGVVDTKDGKYYYVAFLDSYPAGRIPVVAPITFVNDWPVITKVNGEWGKTYPVPVVTSKTVPKSTGLDSFTGSALGPEWEWNHNPDTSKFSLLGGSGGLSLTAATVTSDLFNARNTLTRRIIGPKSSATFRMDLSKLADGDRAGAVLFRDVAAYIGVHKSGSTAQIVMVNNLNLGTNWVTTSTGSVAATGPALASGATDVWFRIQADITPAFGTNTARQTTFWYSTDGSKFTQLGGGFSMSNAWEFFTGYRFGVFNFATKALGGSAVVKSCDVQMV